MVVTPYGHIRLANYRDEQRWLFAHQQEHKRLGMGGLLDGPVDAHWMLRHALQHLQSGAKDSEGQLLRLPGTWRNEQELQSWHLLHNMLHRKLGAG